jgi:major membrane immunogen (membrane-anchored lipoprotein)
MKTMIISGIVAVSILLAGCGKKDGSSGSSAPTKKQQANAASAAVPVTQLAMRAWQQGDKSTAISSFLETDWSARPLFASGSTLSLSEGQFKALSNNDRQAKSSEMESQLHSLKELAAAVAQTGRDAASKGDAAQARKCVTSLKQCGTALDSPDSLLIVQLVGKADEEEAKKHD